MPTYQYLCRDCDHEFEAVQSMRDDALTVCPSCGGPLRKVYAPPAISFKGSGFYATDHGKRKPPSKAADDGSSSDGAKKEKADGSDASSGSGTPAKEGSGPKAAPEGKPDKPGSKPGSKKERAST